MAYEISSSNEPAEPASNDVLDRRAMRRLPDWAKDVVREVCHRHDVPVRDVMGPARTRVAATARHEAIYRVKFAKPSVSAGQLGNWFDHDHSTIIHALTRYQERSGAPILSMRRPQPDRSAA